MNPIKKTFRYHVDASLFAFKWKDGQYIEVEYCANKANGSIVATVTNVSAAPYLIGMIILHNNWMLLMAGIEQAARDHAAKEYKNNVDPMVMDAIKPFGQFINH